MVDLRAVKQQPTANLPESPSSTPKTLFDEDTPAMLGAGKYPSKQASPIRQSPRKVSASRSLPTPVSNSPSRLQTAPSPSALRYPPTFDPSLHHTSSRYSAQQYTPFSPYRPGEYGRSGGLTSGASKNKVERRLFGLFDDEEDEGEGKGRNRGSSPLAPAFQAKMVLRKGAPVDLISWLRKNFHHIPSANTAPTTCPSMSLLAIRTLLLERFPRVPEPDELAKAVTAAFPHGSWDYPSAGSSEPPMIRGLVWHGKDRSDDLDEEMTPHAVGGVSNHNVTTPVKEVPQIVTRSSARASGGAKGKNGIPSGNPDLNQGGITSASRSPTQSTLVSPISSSTRKLLPDTPARSVLEEFAEIATLAEKTPVSKARSLPGDAGETMVPAPAYALANICNSIDNASAASSGFGSGIGMDRKRRRSQSPDHFGRRRASTPDKLHGLLAAAEAVEGSPITHLLGHGHKRRRTIGATTGMRDVMDYPRKRHGFRGNATVSPAIGPRSHLPNVAEDGPILDADLDLDVDGETSMEFDGDGEGEVNSATSAEVEVLDRFALGRIGRAHTESSASQKSVSNVSTALGAGPSMGTYSGVGPPSTASQANGMGAISAASEGGIGAGIGATRAAPRQRKANELPTEGDNPGVDCKPPYPYHELIRYAIENAQDRRLQLSQIYSSIADRFPFFKTLDDKKTAGWQNSIRHNLSLKKMFVRLNKVDGVPDEGGKGGWWTVQAGVPDEGRPGRKAKAKRRGNDDSELGADVGSIAGPGAGVGGGVAGDFEGMSTAGSVENDARSGAEKIDGTFGTSGPGESEATRSHSEAKFGRGDVKSEKGEAGMVGLGLGLGLGLGVGAGAEPMR